jgi:hypothetical protein
MQKQHSAMREGRFSMQKEGSAMAVWVFSITNIYVNISNLNKNKHYHSNYSNFKLMASESRQLPLSTITRLLALNAAKAKHTALGPASFLTTATKNRLLAIQPTFLGKYNDIAVAKQAMVTLTNTKTGYLHTARMFNSHFIQVFNLGIERGTFPVQDRTFYQIDVSSAQVPEMDAEAQVVLWANNLITGDANRILSGGAAMAMPAIAEVSTALTNLDGTLMPHSAAVDAYDGALESLADENEEADAVIKKVWDEVETFHNEEEPSSQRQNAREWGVIYVLRGSDKIVSGQVLDADTNLPVPNTKVSFLNGKRSVISDAEGNYSLKTTLMNTQHLLAENILYQDYDEEVTLVENENLTWNIIIQKVV